MLRQWRKCVVHEMSALQHGNLIDTGCHSQRKNGRQIACLRNQHGVVQVHFPESGKIKDDQKSGYDLADHGCQAAPFDAPAESKDEKRVQEWC